MGKRWPDHVVEAAIILIALGLMFAGVFAGWAVGHATRAQPRTVTLAAGAPAPPGHIGVGLATNEIGDPAKGARLFVSKHCVDCHSYGGRGGTDAPPLDFMEGHVSAREIAGMSGEIWNHLPRMLPHFKEEHIPVPTFAAGEMADLIAYLHSTGSPPPAQGGMQMGTTGSMQMGTTTGSMQMGTTTSACAAGAGLTRTALTPSHRFVLHIGMSERMYTAAQVKKLHPTSGEVMIGGAMMASGMSMGGGQMRHLELQICSRKDGTLLTNAHPTITVLDASAKSAMTMPLEVAVMRGVNAGMGDLHYGNNIAMAAGHSFTITVSLTGERAVFRLRMPMHM